MKTSHFVVGMLSLMVGCGGTPMNNGPTRVRSLQDVPDAAWKDLASKRIFFGHQSVGGNIMEGVSELVRAGPKVDLRVIGADEAPGAEGAFFAHGKIGKNGHPEIKTDDFARLLDEGLASRVDIAFHKYCYADIDAGTDVAAVFEHYKTTMARLRREYPRVVLVHVTTPLLRVQSGPKAVIKKLLDRQPDHYADNMQRERFNDLMRREYGGREPLFDLAAVESTCPDGRRETIRYGDAKSYALVPIYTTDGGHLNETGRRRVAEELLVALAGLASGQ